MNVIATPRDLEKLGRYWTGKAFATNDELQAYADKLGTIKFIARLTIAEHNFLEDLDVELELPDEETNRRVGDMYDAAKAVCDMIG